MEDYDTKKECFQQCLENFACLIMYAYTNEFASVSTLFLNLSYTHKSKWLISMNRFAVFLSCLCSFLKCFERSSS